MEQAQIKHIKIDDLLLVNIKGEIVTAKVTRIIAIYQATNRRSVHDNLQHTAEVDSVHIDSIKSGEASVEVNDNDWVTHSQILQQAEQPSLIKFLFDKMLRIIKTPFTI